MNISLDTDAIRARLDALTTPPPWSVVRDKINDGLIQHGVKGQWNIWAYRPICEPLGGSGNARFIAAAPTDIAALLAEVNRLRVVATIYQMSLHGEFCDCDFSDCERCQTQLRHALGDTQADNTQETK